MKLSVNGQTFYDGDLTDPAPWIAEFGANPADVTVDYSDAELRAMLRSAIARDAGDTLSLLGTATDGAQLLLVRFCELIQGLNAATTIAEVRAAAAGFEPTATALLADIAAGTVKMPFELKGEAAVIAEIGERATAVADAFEANGT